MITFYFVRHGQTTWNLEGKYQGSTDVPLSALGEAQAECAARWFDGKSFDAIYTSPLIRARRTAEAIARRQHTSVTEMAEFQEICFGAWEGLTYDEIEAQWPGAVETMYSAPDTVRIEGGETFAEVEKRTMAGMRRLIAAGDEKTYVIVSHGAAIRTILCGMMGIPLRHAWHFCQGNAAISCLRWYGEGDCWLYLLNGQDHLRLLEERT